jgi:hypothetical protein
LEQIGEYWQLLSCRIEMLADWPIYRISGTIKELEAKANGEQAAT